MSPFPANRPLRVWTNPDAGHDSPSFIALDGETLLLAKVPADDLETTAAALKNGAAIPAQHIPLQRVTRVERAEDAAELTITYGLNGATVTLADASRRDELIDVLAERLGPAWERERRPPARLKAGLWPLGATALLVFFTWVMYGEAQKIAAGQRPPAAGGPGRVRALRMVMRWLEGALGPTGVLAAGAVLVLLALTWLAWRVTRPTVTIALRPRPEE